MPKLVELSQGWTSTAMEIQLDKYAPMPTDKQYYSWYDDGKERRFLTPAYGISNLDRSSSAIQNFLAQNSDAYIFKHIKDACQTTQQTFAIAQEYKVRSPRLLTYAVD